jgi:hypothetical protein
MEIDVLAFGYTSARTFDAPKPVMGIRTPFRILALLLVLFSVPAFTQQDQPLLIMPPDLEHDTGPDTTKGMIQLDVSVTDGSETPVAGLRQEDFTLQDNGAASKVVSVQASGGDKPDSATQVILLIDELNSRDSSQGPTPAQQAESFLRLHEGHLSQSVSAFRIAREGLTAFTIAYFDGNPLANNIATRKGVTVGWKAAAIPDSLAQAAAGAHSGSNQSQSLTALGSVAVRKGSSPAEN